MVRNKKVIVVLPAYNAQKTLKQTYDEIPKDIVDEILLVDDASSDETLSVARLLGLEVIVHERNMGYGANQKTCYTAALKRSPDIVVMLHPDYQYAPRLITAMVFMIESGLFDVVLGSRILQGTPLRHGMPLYKYFSNRVLTLIQNLLMGTKLSEFHTGYRAYTRQVLEALRWTANSNDFVFDNQFLSQIVFAGFNIGEVSCPAKYFPEASSINFLRSLKYGFGCLLTAVQFRMQKWGIAHFKIFGSVGG